jgi:myo-inositol-1(or 4)-monophosphatase
MESIMLETAIEAARAAGQILVERLPARREVRVKGVRDIVTDADLAAEEAVVQTIRARFPDHALLTEEGGESDGSAPYVWVVDPLDGTTNYSRRIPIFNVSIGLVHQGQPAAGVVYDPLRDHLFAVERGRGATLNGAPLRVSQVDRISGAIVSLDWSRSQENRREIVAQLGRIAPACGTVRGLGSAALGLCYVAAGWTDAYFNVGLKPWDMAAGLLLIQEAGGRVTDVEGGLWQPWEQRVLASNGHLHQALLDLMDGVSRTELEKGHDQHS